MNKIAIAAALLAISASAHAGTYTYEGVNAPGYGSRHGGRQLKVQKFHKDMSRFAMTKEDAAPAATDTTPAATPAADAAPAK
jgi:hypothetical protein